MKNPTNKIIICVRDGERVHVIVFPGAYRLDASDSQGHVYYTSEGHLATHRTYSRLTLLVALVRAFCGLGIVHRAGLQEIIVLMGAEEVTK